jgi:hypothetical protein
MVANTQLKEKLGHKGDVTKLAGRLMETIIDSQVIL